MYNNTSLVENLSRHLTAREKLKSYIKEKRAFHVPDFHLDKVSYGDLPLGHLLTPLGFIPLKLLRGTCTRLIHLIGLPGQGKTNLLRMIALESMYMGDHVIIISRKGFEYDSLLSYSNNFYDLDASSIRLNPFYPPSKNISQKEWNPRISQAISSEGYLVYASATSFEQTLDKYSDKFPRRVITPSKLIQFILQNKNYKLIPVEEKVRNRLETMTSGPGKNIFDSNEIIDFEFYAKNYCNFNLSSLSSNQVSYFIAIFLECLTTWKLLNPGEQRHIIILDDYFDLVNEQNDNLPKINELLKTINIFGRKLNIDLWLVSQSVINISNYILDSATTIIKFKTGSLTDAKMKSILNLNTREQEIASKIPKGYVILSRKLIHPSPLLISTPLFPMKELSDGEKRDIMLPRLEQMRSQYMTVMPEQVSMVSEEDELSNDQIHILKDIQIVPYETLSERALKLG
jgi:hypothetical protein